MAVSDSVSELASFEVGERFFSYSDLSFRIRTFEKASSVQLCSLDNLWCSLFKETVEPNT